MLLSKIAEISDNRKKAKEIQKRVQKKRESGDTRVFRDILEEELKKEMSEEKFDDNWTPEEILRREG